MRGEGWTRDESVCECFFFQKCHMSLVTCQNYISIMVEEEVEEERCA